MINQLLKQIILNIDTSGFVLKTKYDTDKSELQNKNPDTSGLVMLKSLKQRVKLLILIIYQQKMH